MKGSFEGKHDHLTRILFHKIMSTLWLAILAGLSASGLSDLRFRLKYQRENLPLLGIPH